MTYAQSQSIFILWEGEYADRDVVAVFTDRDQADAWMETNGQYDVEVRLANPPAQSEEYAYTITLRQFPGRNRNPDWFAHTLEPHKATGQWSHVEEWDNPTHATSHHSVQVWGGPQDDPKDVIAYGKELILRHLGFWPD